MEGVERADADGEEQEEEKEVESGFGRGGLSTSTTSVVEAHSAKLMMMVAGSCLRLAYGAASCIWSPARDVL